MIRDRETNCRKEVSREAQRRRARAAQHVDPRRQAPRPAAHQSPHPAESGCLGSGRSMERQPGSRTPWVPASTQSRGSASNWWKKALRQSWSANTHHPAAEARRLVERFEWHYTPKHGSWLDIAESELSVSRKLPHGRTAGTTSTSKPTGSLRWTPFVGQESG
jgi:hypothetical protein